MKLKTPEFWYSQGKPDVRALALAPAGMIYGAVSGRIQTCTKGVQATVPVLCVGNITAGGSGKTPAAIMICEMVKELEISRFPVFLSRGYGKKNQITGSLIVDRTIHGAEDAGDEPLLLAKHARVVVDGDRVRGAETARELGADFLIMDDGLQNPRLIKDFVIIVIDGSAGFGNGLVMPAGPLREPAGSGLRKGDLVLIVGEDKTGIVRQIPPELPVAFATLHPESGHPVRKGGRYFAFAGIARPQKFFAMVEDLGGGIAGTREFADHHAYTPEDLSDLRKQAQSANASLITTEKDIVKIRRLREDWIPDYLPVKMRLQEASREKVRDILIGKFGKTKER